MKLATDQAPRHPAWKRDAVRGRGASRPGHTALVAVTIACFWTSPALAQTALPQGEWLIDGRAAVQIYDCAGLMCGRIVWLHVPRDARGRLDRDKNNPDKALRERELCGLTIIWNLRPDGPDRWRDGWFYNPDDGATYRLSAHLKAANLIVARVYVLIPLIGKTKTLVRVPLETTDGWC
ncbi:MAG: DUF2147 domain-containing protein [Caulobacter sp.]|nr:DUF2147 domain-containing protein [Caulobacter sp.]